MTILVTGATGFIGQRLCARLVADGLRVRALVLPAESTDSLASAIEIARGDVTVPASLPAAMAGVTAVFHLAARVGDWGPPAAFRAINVAGTSAVLDAAARAGVQRVVHVSSIVVYGPRLRSGGCDEDAPRATGVGPYGETKAESEQIALAAHQEGRVPVTVVRPGNVWGLGSALWVDEVARLLRKRLGLVLDGGHGDAHLAHVGTVVDVLARTLDVPTAAGRIYNAVDDHGVTWRQYFGDLATAMGAPAPTRSMPFGVADALARVMERAWRLTRRGSRPLLTREAVQLLGSRAPVPGARARTELGITPVAYEHGMREIAGALVRA